MRGYCSAGGHRAPGIAQLLLLFAALQACTSTSQQITAPGAASKCTATVAVSSNEFSSDGGEGRVTVTAERDCRWEVQSDATWLTVRSTGETQGSGTASFVVAPTTDPLSRTASLTIVDQRVTITQRAAPCRYRLSSLELSVPPSGGSGEIEVAASSALCEWIAQASADWVSIPTGRTYKGNGRVAFQAAPWVGPMRRAEIAVADQRVVVTQSTGCTYTLTPPSATLPRTAGRGSISVQTGEGCGWTALSSAPWVHITAGASATGPGVAEFSVDANSGAARSATLTIANRPFPVSQASGCDYRLDPAASTFAAAGGPGAIAMNTTAGCPWTAESEVNWITVTAGQTGNGPGVFQIAVAPNGGPQRAGGVRAGGQRFAATQISGCTYSINPASWTFRWEGDYGWIELTTTPDCPWTASSQVDWMVITTPASGVGSAIVRFSITPNPFGERSGTLTIAGHTFVGTQIPRP